MNVLRWCLAALAVAGCTTTEMTGSTPTSIVATAVVDEVIDGDTIRLRIGSVTETVRLLAIDTPETKHPTKKVECFGPQASAFLADLLASSPTVRIERDAEARDVYGRLLLYVFLRTRHGEVFINREMVLRGFARPLNIEPNSRYRHLMVTAAFDARRHARGLWKYCK